MARTGKPYKQTAQGRGKKPTPGSFAAPGTKTPRGFKLKDHPALLLFLIALGVRLVYLVTLAVRPGFELPIVDEVDYDRLAKMFAAGQGFGYGPLFRPPLWPTTLGIVYLLFGPSFPLARLTNCLIGALVVSASYRLGRRLFGHKISFAAGLVLSFYGLLVHFSGSGLSTMLFIYMTVEATALSIAAREHPSWKRYLPAGLLWGLAVITRPVALGPLVIVIADIILRKHIRFSERTRHAAALLLGLAIIISPVTIRNALNGDAAMISTNGGINFYFGNNEQADGIAPYHPAFGVYWTPRRAHIWAESVNGRTMKPTEVSRFYTEEALRFIFLNPGKELKLLWHKLLLSIGGVEVSNNGDLDFMASRNLMLALLLIIGFGVVAPFGFVGMALGWKNKRMRLTALIGICFILITTLFFFNARFRLPAMPFLVLFGAYAGAVILREVNARRMKQAMGVAAAILAVGILVNANLARVPRGGNPAYGYLILGKIYAQEEKSTEAIDSFRKSLEFLPDTPLANLYIGQLLMQQGNAADAVKNFRREIELTGTATAYKWLGYAYRQLGRRAEAEQAFRDALRLEPGNPEVLTLLAQEVGERGLLAADQGKWKEARDLFEEARRTDPSNPFFVFAEASARWALGEKEKAEQAMIELAAQYPSFPPAVEWRNGWRPDTEGGAPLLSPPQKPSLAPMPLIR